jgi:hypothetical protein
MLSATFSQQTAGVGAGISQFNQPLQDDIGKDDERPNGQSNIVMV